MKKPLTSWKRTLGRLGYRVNWDNVLRSKKANERRLKLDGEGVSFNVETLEERQMLSTSISGYEGTEFTQNVSFISDGTAEIHELFLNRGDGSDLVQIDFDFEEVDGDLVISSDVSLLYADDGNFDASVELHKSGNEIANEDYTVSISNVAPIVELSGAGITAEPLVPFQIEFGATDPGNDTVTNWLVNWGDGTTDTIAGTEGGAEHVYLEGGEYSITVTATDEDGTYSPVGLTLDSTFGNKGKVVTDFEGAEDVASSSAVDANGKILLAGYSRTAPETILPGGEDFYFNGSTSRSDLTTGRLLYESDTFVSIEHGQTFRSALVASSGDGNGGNINPSARSYLGYKFYDVDQNVILARHSLRYTGVDTRLAVDLNPGDTQIVLQDATSWYNGTWSGGRSLAWYGYVDSTGKEWADYTYTRNSLINAWNAGGVEGNVITLNAPWAGPALERGAAIRNTNSSHAYAYNILSNKIVPDEPTEFSGFIGNGTTSGSNGLRHGAAYMTALVLANWNNVSGNQLNIHSLRIDPVDPYDNTNFAVARYNEDGSLDSSFGVGGLASVDLATSGSSQEYGTALKLQDDGKILVVGRRVVSNQSYNIAVARLNPDGTLDTTFGNGLGSINTTFNGNSQEYFSGIELQGDKIVVSGRIYDYGNTANKWDFGVARYNNDGSIDETFGDNGLVAVDFDGNNDYAYSVGVQSDGGILVGGRSYVYDAGRYNFGVIKLDINGQLDLNFGPDGTGLVSTNILGNRTEQSTGIIVKEDDTFFLTGYGYPSNTSNDFIVVSYNADGSLNENYGNGGFGRVNIGGNDVGLRGALQEDGKVVISGYRYKTVSGVVNTRLFAVARLTVDGQPDSTFGNNGWATVDFPGEFDIASSVALSDDGGIIVSGYHGSNQLNSDPQNRNLGIAKFLPNNTVTAEAAQISINEDLRLVKTHEHDGPLAILEGVGPEVDLGGLTVTIDWGDTTGTTTGTLSRDAENNVLISGTHTYATFGLVPFVVTVSKGADTVAEFSEDVIVYSQVPINYFPENSDEHNLGTIQIPVAGIDTTYYRFFEYREVDDDDGATFTAEIYRLWNDDLDDFDPSNEELYYRFDHPDTGTPVVYGYTIDGNFETMRDRHPRIYADGYDPADNDDIYETNDAAFRATFLDEQFPEPGEPGRYIMFQKMLFEGGHIWRDFSLDIDWGAGDNSPDDTNRMIVHDYFYIGQGPHIRTLIIGGEHVYTTSGSFTAELTFNGPLGFSDDSDTDSYPRFEYGTSHVGHVEFNSVADASIALAGKVDFVNNEVFSGPVAAISGFEADADLADFEGKIRWGDGEVTIASFERGFGNEINVVGTHEYKMFGEVEFIVEVTHSGASLDLTENVIVWSKLPRGYEPDVLQERQLGSVEMKVLGIETIPYEYDRNEWYQHEDGSWHEAEIYVAADGSELTYRDSPGPHEAILGEVDGQEEIFRDWKVFIGENEEPPILNDGVFSTRDAAYRAVFVLQEPDGLDGPGGPGGPGGPSPPSGPGGPQVARRIDLRKMILEEGKTFNDLTLDVDWGAGADPENAHRFLVQDHFYTYDEDDEHIREFVIGGTNTYAAGGNHVITFDLGAPEGIEYLDDGGNFDYGNEHTGHIEFLDLTLANPVVDFVDTNVVTGIEGNQFEIQLSLSHAVNEVVCVHLGDFGGDAILGTDFELSGADYNANTNEVRFAAGTSLTSLTVTLLSDDIKEGNENFSFEMLGVLGASRGTNITFNGQILDPTVQVAISSDQVSNDESNVSSTQSFTFTIERSGYTSGTTTAVWNVQPNGNAELTAEDFEGNVFPSGSVEFAPGETSKQISFNVNGDNDVESNESFEVAVTATDDHTDFVFASPNSAESTITNDDIDLSIAASGPTEQLEPSVGGETVFEYTVTRTGDTAGTTTVDYLVVGTDVSPEDFIGGQLPAGTVTFEPGETESDIQIRVAGDTLSEGDEAFTVVLLWPTSDSQPDHIAEINEYAAEGLILDNQVDISIDATDAVRDESHNEETSPFTFTVTKSGNIAGDTRVYYEVEGVVGGATADDFAGDVFPSHYVDLGPGIATGIITVFVKGDRDVEAYEDFIVKLTNATDTSAAPVIVEDEASGTIVNDDIDVGVLLYTPEKLEGNDGTTTFVFTLQRTGETDGETTVAYQFTGDLNGDDLAPGQSSSGTVTFGAGSTGTQSITLQIQGDSDVEFDEDFHLKFTSASDDVAAHAVDLLTDQVTATVINDDIDLSISGPDVDFQHESNNGSETVYRFVVTRTGDLEGVTTVEYAITGDTDLGDFVDPNELTGIVTFVADETEQEIVIRVSGDNDVELDETFTVTLSNPADTQPDGSVDSVDIVNATATATIVNDDIDLSISGPDVDFQHESNDGSETVYRFVVTRSGDLEGDTTVEYAITGDTDLVDFVDPNELTGIVTFVADETEQEIVIRVSGDNDVEPNETFTVTLSNPADTQPDGSVDSVDIVNATATATIVNDDIDLSISGPDVDFQHESNDGSEKVYRFVVTRTGDLEGVTTVEYAITGDTDLGDFVDPNELTGIVTFVADETEQEIVIRVSGDNDVELDETFTVTLSNPADTQPDGSVDSVDIVNATTTATIVNDDIDLDISGPDVDFQDESNSGSETEYRFVVTRTGDLEGITTVEYAIAGDTDLGDFVDPNELTGTVTFVADETEQEIVVRVSGDNDVELDETFTVTLSNPADTQPDGSVDSIDIVNATATATIVNDDIDLDVTDIQLTKFEGAEGQTTAFTFKIVRLGDNAGFTYVDYQIDFPNSIANAADFVSNTVTGTAEFDGPEESEYVVTIEVLGDHEMEDDENFVVTLNGAGDSQSNHIVELLQDTVNGTILNDETNLAISADDDVLDEGNSVNAGADFEFDVLRTGKLWNTWVEYRVVGIGLNPATADDFKDGVFPTGTLHFAPDSELESILVTLSGETEVEPNEDFMVELFNATGEANDHVTIAPSTAEATIFNDDIDLIVSPIAMEQYEGNYREFTEFTFSIERTGDLTGVTTVDYKIDLAASMADADDFFGDIVGTVTFDDSDPANNIQTVTLVVQGDHDVEPDETFVVLLTSPNDSQPNHVVELSQTSITGTIVNDDIRIRIEHDLEVDEGNDVGNSFNFLVEREGLTAGFTTVQWVLNHETTDDDDFVATQAFSGTFVFIPGQTEKYITVDLQGDTDVEIDEEFEIELDSVSDSATTSIVANPGVSIGNIINDDIDVEIFDGPELIEGDDGDKTFSFMVERYGDTMGTTYINWEVSGSDVDAADFGVHDATTADGLPAGVLELMPGQVRGYIEVKVSGDLEFEKHEDFMVELISGSDDQTDHVVEFINTSAAARILNDDTAPDINSAPVFTSEHVVDAYIGTGYEYQSTATDSDGDSLEFSMGNIVWPDGFDPTPEQEIQFEYINDGIDQRGIYTWDAPAELSGETVIVEEIVNDGFNLPVTRTFEIYVHPTVGNNAPIITSDPATNYTLAPTVTDYENDDEHVYPDFIAVTLANGEEYQVDISIDPSGLASPTADVVFSVDITGSMGGAVDWLSERKDDGAGNEIPGSSVVEQVESKLNGLGIGLESSNRYGLVAFYLEGQTSNPATLPLSIAIGNVDLDTPPFSIWDIPLSQDSDELWGSVEQLRTAIDLINPDDGYEAGYSAIGRILTDAPVELYGSIEQHPYEFRGEATVNVVHVTDYEVIEGDHNYDTKQELIATLVGNSDVEYDDIIFTTVMPAHLTGHDGLGNDSRFLRNDNGWAINESDFEFTPNAQTTNGIAVFDIQSYSDEIFGQFNLNPVLNNWATTLDFVVPESDALEANPRLIFGSESTETSQGTLPSVYWFLQSDIIPGEDEDVWSISASDGTPYPISLHPDQTWPQLEYGETISVELRMIRIDNGRNTDSRFDLFINGEAIGSVEIAEYLDDQGTGFGGNYGFFGFGSVAAQIKAERMEVRGSSWSGLNQLLSSDQPTPFEFSDPNTDYVFKRFFFNEFGTVDGSSFDDEIFGIDVDGSAYVYADSPEGYERTPNPNYAHTANFEEPHYIPLVQSVGGSIWNLGVLRGGDTTYRDPFSNAFTDSLAQEILIRNIWVNSESEVLTDVEPFYDDENPFHASFHVTLTGDGSADIFDLDFVRVNDAGVEQEEFGSIPVILGYAYSHDFEVVDVENDTPFTFQFDPEFLDDDGNIITNGATLVDSGREGMISDRLLWTPEPVAEPTEFQFRVIVTDSAGQIGKKDWTVTVYPVDNDNTPPEIDITGLMEDENDDDGFVNEPKLPNAIELQGYGYQVIATDVDERDQGNLRYYLRETVDSEGNETPVPTWMNIDRNTGLIYGRPGSYDVGPTHVTVRVSDGRLYFDEDGNVLAPSTEQVFSITVDERGAINFAPRVDPIPSLAVRVGQTYDYQVVATDQNSDQLTYSLLAAPNGMVIDSLSGEIVWVPTIDHLDEVYSVTVSVSDGITSTDRGFRIAVVGENRAPVLMTELPDGVTYADYQQPFTASDADGDAIISVIKAPIGMDVGYGADGRLNLIWPQADILAGLHRVELRIFDGAGGVTEEHLYINFEEFAAPKFFDGISGATTPNEISNDDFRAIETTDSSVHEWRAGGEDIAYVYVSSLDAIDDFQTSFAIDRSSGFAGMSIVESDIVEHEFTGADGEPGTFFAYKIPVKWRPQYEGEYDVKISAKNNIDTSIHDFKFTVNPFVTQAENSAPVFPGGFLGPYERDTVVYMPLDVVDPNGHNVTLSILEGSDLIPEAIQNNTLIFNASISGIFDIRVSAENDAYNARDVGPVNYGIAVDDFATGTGWILHSSESLLTRFADKPIYSNNSEHMIAVRFENGTWEYNANGDTWHRFSRRADDVLIAEVDFDADTITSLEGTAERIQGIATGYLSGDLTFESNRWNGQGDTGEFTVSGTEFVISENMTSIHEFAIVISDNATPAILYSFEPHVRYGEDEPDYLYEIYNIFDPNADDTIRVTLNQDASDAGIVLLDPDPDDEFPRYKLSWTQDSIGEWVANNDLPGFVPIVIEVEDNHGASSSINFELPVRDPSQLPEFADSYDFDISANRSWEQKFEVTNPGGHEISFQLFAYETEDREVAVPLPEDIQISYNDGLMTWNPSVELLAILDEMGNPVLDENGLPTYHDELDYFFEVLVILEDGENRPGTEVPMDITLIHPSIFFPFVPEIDTEATPPPNAAIVDQTLVYEPELKPFEIPEHEDEVVIWSLESAPEGMEIDEATGVLTWTPDPALLDSKVDVNIRVSSAQGAGTNLEFTLDVNAVNRQPLFTSTFPTKWEEGVEFRLETRGYDPEGHHLTYELLAADGGDITEDISIDAETGIIVWLSPETGPYEYIVRVSEEHNPSSFAERPLTLNVIDPTTQGDPLNYEPLIIGNPQGGFASYTITSDGTVEGDTFEFDFDVLDPDQETGVDHTYELVEAPASATVGTNDGIFEWTPGEGEDGVRTFQLKVTDVSPHNGVADNVRYLTFQLEAIENYAPVFDDGVETSFLVNVSTNFVYQFEATDEDGEAITFSLESSNEDPIPSGMRIDSETGELRWFVEDKTDPYNVENVVVVATDKWGAEDRRTLSFEVTTDDISAPVITYYMKDTEGNIIAPGSDLIAQDFRSYDLWIDIRDNRGIYLPGDIQNGSWIVTVSNTGANPVSFGFSSDDYFGGNAPGAPRHGLWKIDLEGSGLNQGQLEVDIEAYDEAGNISTRYARYYVKDPDAEQYAKILNLNQNSPPITDRFEVMGNAFYFENDGGYGRYDLKLTDMDDPSDFVYLAKNELAIVTDALIGVVDGTLIPTGHYRLYLELRCDEGCIQYVDERIIEVQNEAKLGDLNLTFSDLDVSLGGIPIPLIRTYNSGLVGELDEETGDGSFDADFSPGWNLNFLQSRISVSHPNGTTTSLNEAFADGSRVFVSLPNGDTHRFTFDPVPFGNVFVPNLNPDPEFNSQLYLRDYDERLRFVPDETRGDGTYVSTNNNSPSVPSNFGTAWILETENGLEYIFDIDTGELRSIQDWNDGRVDIVDRLDDGSEIVIATRNTGENNRDDAEFFEEIVISREAQYRDQTDANGNTQPVLDGFRVLSISDPSDEDIPETSDVNEDLKIEYTYIPIVNGQGEQISANLDQVTHRDGLKENYAYDNAHFAHHLTGIDDNAAIEIFSAQYFDDLNGDGIIDTADRAEDAFGRLEKTFNANGIPTNFDFDLDLEDGRKVRSTNRTGIAIEDVFNGRGDILRTLQLVHDSTQPEEKTYLAAVTRYNLRGLITAQSRPFYIVGAENRFDSQPPEPEQDPNAWENLTTYDEAGRVLTSFDPINGMTTNYFDDANGIFRSTDPYGVTSWKVSNPESGKLLETYQTVEESGFRYNHIRYVYNDYGQRILEIQIFSDGSESVLSESAFDEKGRQISSHPSGSPKQYFAYNRNGNRILSWNSVEIPGTSQFLTTVEATVDDFAGPENQFSEDGDWTPTVAGGTSSASFEVVGTEYTSDNSEDLLLAIQDFESNPNISKSLQSNSVQNQRGRNVRSSRVAIDSDGSATWFVIYSHEIMDGGERIAYRTDEREILPDGESYEPHEQAGTRTYYDAHGRVYKTERLKGLIISVDGNQTGYGESTLVDEANIEILSTIETIYNELGRVDARVNYTTNDASSALREEFVYNLLGQIVETRTQDWNHDGSDVVTFVSRRVYDDQNRLEYETDSYLVDATSAPSEIVYSHKSVYNSLGQIEKTLRLKNTIVEIDEYNNTSIAEDINGNLLEGELLFESQTFFNKGRVESTVDGEGHISDTRFDWFGRQIASIEPTIQLNGLPARHRTELSYNERGQVELQRSNIVYDGENGEHDETEVQETRYIFDESGRLARTIYDDLSYVAFSYDERGRTIAESGQVDSNVNLVWRPEQNTFVDANDGDVAIPTRTMEYDPKGQLTAVELPAVAYPNNNGVVTRPRYEYKYDARGNQTFILDPLGRETRIEYDRLGRQASRTLPLGFGEDGRLVGDEEPSGTHTEHYRYDELGRRYLHISFEGVVTQHSYDAKTSRLIEVAYYDSLGTYNDGSGTANGRRVYSYDDHGRVTESTLQIGNEFVRTETTTYTQLGLPETITTWEGAIKYDYDEFGRVQRKSFSGREFINKGPAVGDFDNIHEYEYDELGRLKTVKVVERNNAPETELTTYSYDLVGNLDRIYFANGLIHEYEYDDLNRLRELYHWVDLNDDGIRSSDPNDDEWRAEFLYALRDQGRYADGKRSGVFEKIWDSNGTLRSSSTFAWTYDDAGRLTNETADFSNDRDYSLEWTYDLTGNRVLQVRTPIPGLVETTAYEYNANDQLTLETFNDLKVTDYSYTNPDSGIEGTQLLSKIATQNYEFGGGQVIRSELSTYNLQGRLASVVIEDRPLQAPQQTDSTISYEYDSQGNRVATTLIKTTSGVGGGETTHTRTEYLTDSQNHTGYSQVLQETDFDENGDAVSKTVYSIGHDQIAQTIFSPEATGNGWTEESHAYFGTDGHGSVRVLFDATTAILRDADNNLKHQIFHFDAYGNLLNFSIGTPLTAYLYSGEAFDFGLGQQYLRARFYDATTGRFNRLDPFAGNSNDPQSFHKYAYVHGDPVQGTDPTGKFLLGSLVFANGAGITASATALAQGMVIIGILESGGKIGFALRDMGLIMISDGSFEMGFYAYNTGVRIVKLTFDTIQKLEHAVGAASIGALATYGAMKMAARAPSLAKNLLKLRKAVFKRGGGCFVGETLVMVNHPNHKLEMPVDFDLKTLPLSGALVALISIATGLILVTSKSQDSNKNGVPDKRAQGEPPLVDFTNPNLLIIYI